MSKNKPIHTSRLDKFLLDKDKSYEEHTKNVTNEYVRLGGGRWTNGSGVVPEEIEIEYDKKMNTC